MFPHFPFGFRILLIASAAMFLAAVTQAQEIRTWTDATGTYTFKAKFDSVADGEVTLIGEDGEKVTIALEQLSKADQEFIAKLKSANPFKRAGASPFKPIQPRNIPQTTSPRTVTVDWSSSREIVLEAANSDWNITVPEPGTEFRPKSVPLSKKTDFFEKLAGMAINVVAKKAVVGYTLAKHGSDATTRIVMCDLERGRTAASASTKAEMAPIALHDDGRHVLMRHNVFGFGNLERLEIWSIQGKDIVRSLIWTPYEDIRGGGRDVMWAEFIDADTLATSSRSGRVAIWNLASAEPICHFQLTDGAVPALSPDRKWIALSSSDRIGLFDIEKQEIAVMQETPGKLTWPYVAFSPSGQRIGCIAQDRILVWDTASGQLERDFGTPGIHIHGAIAFPDDGFILANNQYLVALESQLKLWQYRGVEHARTVGGSTFLGISGGTGPGVLAAAQLPHPEAAALLEKALNQPDLFVFREGATVSLDVRQVPASHQRQVADVLTKKLSEMDCQIAARGNVVLMASVEGPKQKSVSYMHSGDYQVQEYRTRLKFVYQGKPIWEASGTNIPGFVSLKRGENLEGVLRKASQQPSFGFYDRVVLPKFLQKPSANQGPGAGQTLGTSQVTPQGFR